MGAVRFNKLTTTYQILRGCKHSETTVKEAEFNQTLKQKKCIKHCYMQRLLCKKNML